MIPNSPAQDDKFDTQLSPLLELMYMMVVDMKKYLKIYAEDIKVDDLPEYKEIADALQALKIAFDKIYGIEPGPKEILPPKIAEEKVEQNKSETQDKKPDFEAMKTAFDHLRQIDSQPTKPAELPQQMVQPQQSQPVNAISKPNRPGMSVPTPMVTERSLPVHPEAPAISFQTEQPEQLPQPSINPIGMSTPMAAPQLPVQPQVPSMPQTPQIQVASQPQPQQNTQSQLSEIDSILAELRKLQSNNG